VAQWNIATEAQLAKYSAQAAATFIRSRPFERRTFMNRHQLIQLEYLTLHERLDHLIAIIERPEVYCLVNMCCQL